MNPLHSLLARKAQPIALAPLALLALALMSLGGCATPSHTPRYAGECVTQLDGLAPYAGADCHTCPNVTVGVADQPPRCGMVADTGAQSEFSEAQPADGGDPLQ